MDFLKDMAYFVLPEFSTHRRGRTKLDLFASKETFLLGTTKIAFWLMLGMLIAAQLGKLH